MDNRLLSKPTTENISHSHMHFFSKTSESSVKQSEYISVDELDIRRKVYLSTLDRDDMTDQLIAHLRQDYVNRSKDIIFIPYRYNQLGTRQAKDNFFIQVLHLLTDSDPHLVFNICKIIPTLYPLISTENKNDMHRMLTSIRNTTGLHDLIYLMVNDILRKIAQPSLDAAMPKPETPAPALHL